MLSSTGALELSEIPKKLIVIGAGAIGLELGSVYRRLGSEVTFVGFLDRICPPLDADIARALHTALKKQGMEFLLSHKAYEWGVAVAEIIAGENPGINYLTIPNVVYTWPEAAGVGLTEEEAKKAGLEVKSGRFFFKGNSRAQCMGEDEGLVKVIAEVKTDRLVGVHLLGPHASEMIGEAAAALASKMTATELGHLPHAHPTLSEAIKEAALAVHGRPLHA